MNVSSSHSYVLFRSYFISVRNTPSQASHKFIRPSFNIQYLYGALVRKKYANLSLDPFSKGKHVTILNCRVVLNVKRPMNLMKHNKLSRPNSIQRETSS